MKRESHNIIKRHITKQRFTPDVVRNPIGMDEPWHYRNKMEFTFSPEGELGLHEQGNFRKIVPLETCLIMDPDKKDVVLEIADWVKAHGYPGYDKDTHEGLFRHVMVRKSFATGEVMLAIFATESYEKVEHVDELVSTIEDKYPFVKSLLWLENRDEIGRAHV